MSREFRALILGGLNMDIQAKSRGAMRPGDSNPGAANLSPGGVGRNIAENLSRLGVKTELVSVLGGDALSRALEEDCRALGIGLSGSLKVPEAAASQYLCLLDSDGSLFGAVAAMELMERLLPEVLPERASLFDAADLIVADANLPETSLLWLARRFGPGGEGSGQGRSGRAERREGAAGEGLKARKPLLLLDTVSAAKAARAREAYRAFDILKPNRAEAAVLSGLPIEAASRLAPSELARALRKAADRGSSFPGSAEGTGVGVGQEYYISLGAEGLYVDAPGGRGLARPPRLPVANVSGAGDAAAAALAWAALRGLPFPERARLAVAAAALTAASETTVSADMNPQRLEELAQGAAYESLP